MAVPDWIPETACNEVRFFCDYWLRLKGEAHLPACDLIDPLDFFRHLSGVFIVEGRRLDELHIRLAGTVYRDLYGFEITGKPLADLIPFSHRPDLLDDYARCLHDRQDELAEARLGGLLRAHPAALRFRSRGRENPGFRPVLRYRW
jgi:hypothetical protein